MTREPAQSASQTVGQLPRHVAIIMDGNGRWARGRNLPRPMGHREGVKAVRRAVEACRERGIEALTLFAFSSENWRRPKAEVSLLMELFMHTIRKEIDELDRNAVRVRFIGERSAFDPKMRSLMERAEQQTADNQGLSMVIAVNYGGRWDIANAARQLAARATAGEIDVESIDSEALGQCLSLADLPEPDLFIRTGGEQRISNFLLWQLAYTELYFTDLLWPDFDDAAFEQALRSFSSRQRRFGQTGDQVEQSKRA
jgi:undecaprenyl diphosphate synthase